MTIPSSKRRARLPGFAVLMSSVAAVAAASAAGNAAAATTTASNDAAAAEVKQLESTLEQIYNSPQFAKDPSIALKYFDSTEALRMFDIMVPTEFHGKEFRKHFIEVGSQFSGGRVEFSEIEITTDGNLAFASSLQHFFGRGKDGKPYDMTMRVTDCLRKSAGHWLILHEHVSLPLDPATFMSVITPKQ